MGALCFVNDATMSLTHWRVLDSEDFVCCKQCEFELWVIVVLPRLLQLHGLTVAIWM